MFHWYKRENRICGRILPVLICSVLLVFSFVFQTVALAEADLQTPWAPDAYEIHLLLNSNLILDENHLLKQEFLNLFGTNDTYKTFSLAYYETKERDFFEEGWINRIRLK